MEIENMCLLVQNNASHLPFSEDSCVDQQATTTQTAEEYYHSLAYYREIDKAGSTYSKIDSPESGSRQIAQLSTDKIREVLREVLREPIAYWTMRLVKNATERRADDVGIAFEANLLPPEDLRKVVKMAGTSKAGVRVPREIARNLGMNLSIEGDLPGILGVDLCHRILGVFLVSYRAEFLFLKTLCEKIEAKPIQEKEFTKNLLLDGINEKVCDTTLLRRLALEVHRRMVAVSSSMSQVEVAFCLIPEIDKRGLLKETGLTIQDFVF
jgi:hypothetical protein